MAPTAFDLTPSKPHSKISLRQSIAGTIVNAFKTRVTGVQSVIDPSNNNHYLNPQQSTHGINSDQGSPSSSSTPAVLQAWDDPDASTPDMKNISSATALKLLKQQSLQEQRDLSLPTFPTSTSARLSTVTTTLKQLKFYMSGGDAFSPFSPNNVSVKSGATEPSQTQNQWPFSDRFFYSRDDQSVSVFGQSSWESNVSLHNQPALAGVVPIIYGADGDGDGGDDDETIKKARRRFKKKSRASTVNAFVIFLKALFGVSMLSNPAVLGEVGLLMGTFCHLLIVVGCAFACYLLLTARQFAKIEVMASERRDEERREAYDMWRMETERRSAVRMRRSEEIESSRTLPQNNVSTEITLSSTVAIVKDGQTLQVANAGGGTVSDDGCMMDTMPLSASPLGGAFIPATSTRLSRSSGAYPTVKMSTIDTSAEIAAQSNFAAAPSRGKVQIDRQSIRSQNNQLLDSKSSGNRGGLNSVIDEYQIFSDDSLIPQLPPPPPKQMAQVRLITYGDVAKCIIGKQAGMLVVFAMVTGHIMFASGLLHLAIENLCYVVGWERLGWSYTEVYVEEDVDDRVMMRRLEHGQDGGEHNNPNHSASRSSDEEEYYLEWKGPDFLGRMAMACLLFPIIHGLLQIPSLTELATISTVGLATYAVGCIGSMLYSAVVLTDGHPFTDQPDDMWTTKWSGIPVYVATTIYCIEGINLALPTVCSIEDAQRSREGLMQPLSQSKSGANEEEDKKRDVSVFIVVGAVFLYGIITLIVSWIGLAGGLGGGVGTIHGEDGCWDVTYCLNSSAVRFVYMLSLGIALVLTLPVILYPSTQMLEVWLDDRNDERRRKMVAASTMPSPLKVQPFWSQKKSLLSYDDESFQSATDTVSPRPMGIHHDKNGVSELSCSTGAGKCAVPSRPSPAPSLLTSQYDDNSLVTSPITSDLENTKVKATRKLKYWKLRMCIAVFICVFGTIEGSFPSVLKATGILRGVSLSITGLIVPPLLYMSAVGGDFSVPMAAAMASLIGLGLFNIVLVFMSAFGSKDFILEEGRQNFMEEHG
ncbi:hypothetical protein ACHAW5_009342 [Stephanodiscus triporus]|uniref:Amino acid transporter transmembrane domain-containing protein n=1 Tax=Stephanodiscus triporus TaxID=2934178 RepID=A0ABD3NTW2_9STRA